MRTIHAFAAALGLSAATLPPPSYAADAQPLISWAYPSYVQRQFAPPPPPPELKRVPDSSLAVSLQAAMNPFTAPDWHPEDHPPAPPLILRGRRSDVESCAHCHLPNGLGSTIMQAPSLAGLSVSYITQQIADFKSGVRKSAVEKYTGTNTMKFVTGPMNDEDTRIAAEYFSKVQPKPWFHVVEAARVPVTKGEQLMTVKAEGDAMEALGTRIIEVPDDVERTYLRDARSGFTAYVPPGSIKRGEALVTTGRKGTTQPCAVCHGANLEGVGPVPALAGRSPTYIVRQLYDIQQGARAGAWSALMVPVVAKLTESDIIDIAAYAASRTP